jgi:rod shape determining protein RodA
MKIFQEMNRLVLISLFILFSLSLTMIWSLAPQLFLHQLFFVMIGFSLFFLCSKIDIEAFKGFSWLVYGFSLFFLFSTFIFGQLTRGTVRWIEIGGFTFQPSELIKPLVIFFFASFLAEAPRIDLKKLGLCFLLLLPLLLLVFIQPDLGSSLVILVSWLGIIFAGGLNFLFLLGGGFLFLVLMPLFWFLMKDYQKERILSFLDPYQDPLKTGYHVIQAMIAIGAGGLFGRGLGRGSQSQLLFLPERHTDFIFASLVEELGLAGSLLLLLAYGLLLYQILRISQQSTSKLGQLFCLGFFSQMLFQVFVNLGMNLGMVPITGVTLPLVSYGGSSLVATMVGLGIVVGIGKFNSGKTEALEIR